jgi:hypothetical protein
MSKGFSFSIKNKELEQFIREYVIKEHTDEEIVKMSYKEQAKTILGGFLVDVACACQENEIEFDLLYSSLNQFNKVIAALYKRSYKIGGKKEATDTVAKAILAYFTMLCANEHDCSVEYVSLRNPLLSQAGMENLLKNSLSGVSVRVGIKEKTDFYASAMKTVSCAPFDMGKGLFVNMSPIIVEYERVTGVDLRQYGIGEIMIEN